MKNSEETDIQDFDKLVLGDRLTLFKVLIPYIDYKNQKLFAIIIRIMEFKLTLDFYSNPDCCYRNSKKSFNTDELIKDLKSNCPPKYQNMLEQINMLMSMSEYMDIFSKADNIMDTFQKFTGKENEHCNSTPFSSSPMDLINGMLSDSQKDLLKQYNDILNN